MQKLWSTIEEMLIHSLHLGSVTFDGKPYEHLLHTVFLCFLESQKELGI
jgi:hypothetical protein